MMKNILLCMTILPVIALSGCGDSGETPAKDSKKNDSDRTVEIQTVDTTPRYILYPTTNMWTFIKLDSRTGLMWLVQYSVSDKQDRFTYDLNPKELIEEKRSANGRFCLTPTQNLYNFILLDQVDGRTWQVQWSFDKEQRFVVPINLRI